MATDCTYCSLARKTGELFCSRHQSDMTGLDSGIFYIKEKHFEQCEPHVTRLSLNFNLDTHQPYFIGNKQYTVTPKKYLLINEGQSFTTLAESDRESRMVTIAFKVGLAREMYYNLNSSCEQLLAEPVTDTASPLQLFEQIHFTDSYLEAHVPELIALSEQPKNNFSSVILQEQLEQMLLHILTDQLRIRRDVRSIARVKPSTRMEIYKRLHLACEFMHDNFTRPVSVNEIASHALLSPFNFKRLFKEFYHQTPHQFLNRLRIARACDLLKEGRPVKEVCMSVGFEDVSSFIRLFRKTMSSTPAEFGRS